MAEINLTGFWTGHYYQHSRAHPMTADLVQTGNRLSGTMTDTDTYRAQSVFETALEAGLPPGADEQITAKLREMFPDAAGSPIRYVVELPSRSVVEGTINERSIHFKKTYEGEHFSGYEVGTNRVGDRIENHVVQYRGHVSADGAMIEGQWSITHQSEQGKRTVEGAFELRRTEKLALD
jgi:hypothetical protein